MSHVGIRAGNILKQHSQCQIYTTPLSIQHAATDTYISASSIRNHNRRYTDVSLPGRAKSNTQPQTAPKEVILMTGFCDPGLQIGKYKAGINN